MPDVAARPRRSAARKVHKNDTPMTLTATAAAAPKRSTSMRKRARQAEASDAEASGSGEGSTAGSEDESELSDATSFDSGSEVDMDESHDFVAPGAKNKNGRASGASTARKSGSGAAGGVAGKKRKSKAGPKAPKAPKAPRTKRKGPVGAWKGGKTTGPSRSRAVGNKEELNIRDDNALFNAIKDPETSMQTAAEESVVQYGRNAGEAFSQLVTFFLRCSGCNSTIDEHAAQDVDAIVDKLDEVQEVFKKAPLPSYPLVSRATAFRKFRSQLADFMQQLVTSAAEADALYDETFLDTIMAWVSAMSSSSFRSFRHTATAIALFLVDGLASVLVEAKKETTTAVRNRDAEKKKARADKARLKELEAQVKACGARTKTVSSYIDEIISTVYVHRYRDSDPSIRTDCVEELTSWMRSYPETFLQSSYFRYVGWVLSDPAEPVRIAAIKGLGGLYGRRSSGLPHPLRHFTDMFKGRLIDMAVGDVDVSIRTTTIHVLIQIDRHELLSDEQRNRLASHIFDVEPRVRVAVAGFVAGMLEEEVDADVEALGEEPDSESPEHATWASDVAKLRLKMFASLLVRLGERLDASQNEEGDESATTLDTTRLPGNAHPGRIGMAISALWEGVEVIQDWKPLIELLLLDHTGEGEPDNVARKGKSGAPTSSTAAPAPYKLAPAEESVLVEALVAVVTKIQQDSVAAASKPATAGLPADDEQDKPLALMSRHLIGALPKLFAKYRTDGPRITEVLRIPLHMDLSVYAETQQLTAYEALWDEVVDQFSRHVEEALLHNAVQAIGHLARHEGLAHVNGAKLSALQDELVASLREAVQGRDVETATFSEDEVHALAACTSRIKNLVQVSNMAEAMADDDKGAQTAGWEIVMAVASRGRLGYEEEQKTVCNALVILGLCLMWHTRNVFDADEGSDKDALAEALLSRRTTFLALANEYMGGEHAGAQLVVLREALCQALDIYTMYASISARDETRREAGESSKLPGLLQLMPSAEVQERCTNFVKEELDRFAESLRAAQPADEEEEEQQEGENQEQEADETASQQGESSTPAKASKNASKSKKAAAAPAVAGPPTHADLLRQHVLCQSVSRLIKAIRLGAFEMEHAIPLLAFWGRLGRFYDTCAKYVLDALRDQGVYGGKSYRVCEVAFEALKGSWEAYAQDPNLDGENAMVSLGRNLAAAMVVRGPGLTVLRAIRATSLVHLHDDANAFTAKRIAQAERTGNKAAKAAAITFWKALSQLLVSADGRDAVKIKSGLDKALADASVEVPPTSKAYEPLRSYEKRLMNIASKNVAMAKMAATAVAEALPEKSPEAGAQGSERDAEGEVDEGSQHGDASARESAATSSRPRPKATAAVTPSKRRSRMDHDEDGEGLDLEDIENQEPSRTARAESELSSVGGMDITEDIEMPLGDDDAALASQSLQQASSPAGLHKKRRV